MALRKRSTFEVLDNWLLIGVGVVAVFVALNIVSWAVGALFGFVWFLVKVAIAAVVIGAVVSIASGRRRRLDRGWRGELD